MRSNLLKFMTLCVAVGVVGCAAPIKQSQRSEVTQLPESWNDTQAVEAQWLFDGNPQRQAGDSGRNTELVPPLPSLEWLTDFSDPQLLALVATALQSNKALRIQRINKEVASLNVQGVAAVLWPDMAIELDSGITRGVTGSSPSRKVTSRQYSGILTTEWELDIWGKNQQALSAAEYDLLGAETLVAATELSIAGMISKHWFGLLELAQQNHIERTRIANLRETVSNLHRQVVRGLVQQLDLDLARTDLRQAETRQIAIQGQLNQARYQLQPLLGQFELANHKLDAGLPAWQSLPIIQLPVKRLLARPDLQAAFLAIQSADALAASAYWNRFPGLTLTADVGRSVAKLRDLDNQLFDVSNLTASILAPVFDAGLRKAEQTRRERHAEIEAVKFQQALLQAFFEVETAVASEYFLKREYEASHRALQSAVHASQVAIGAYQKGLIGALEFLAIQRQEINFRSQQVALHKALLNNRVDLQMAFGGSYSINAVSLANRSAARGIPVEPKPSQPGNRPEVTGI